MGIDASIRNNKGLFRNKWEKIVQSLSWVLFVEDSLVMIGFECMNL